MDIQMVTNVATTVFKNEKTSFFKYLRSKTQTIPNTTQDINIAILVSV